MTRTTADLIAEWAERLAASGYTAKTRRTYLSWAARLAARFPEISARTFPDAVCWASASLARQNYSPTTIHQFQKVMATFGRDMLDMPDQLTAGLVTCRPRRPRFALPNREQLTRIRAALGENHRVMFDCCLALGMRISEVADLRIGDVDLDNRRVTVRDSKANSSRKLAIPQDMLPALTRQYKRAWATQQTDEERRGAAIHVSRRVIWRGAATSTEPHNWPLFPARYLEQDPRSQNQQRPNITPRAFRRALTDARRLARVPVRVTPHRLRECYAVHEHDRGATLATIARALGHRRLDTTAKYLSSVFNLSEKGA